MAFSSAYTSNKIKGVTTNKITAIILIMKIEGIFISICQSLCYKSLFPDLFVHFERIWEEIKKGVMRSKVAVYNHPFELHSYNLCILTNYDLSRFLVEHHILQHKLLHCRKMDMEQIIVS